MLACSLPRVCFGKAFFSQVYPTHFLVFLGVKVSRAWHLHKIKDKLRCENLGNWVFASRSPRHWDYITVAELWSESDRGTGTDSRTLQDKILKELSEDNNLDDWIPMSELTRQESKTTTSKTRFPCNKLEENIPRKESQGATRKTGFQDSNLENNKARQESQATTDSRGSSSNKWGFCLVLLALHSCYLLIFCLALFCFVLLLSFVLSYSLSLFLSSFLSFFLFYFIWFSLSISLFPTSGCLETS